MTKSQLFEPVIVLLISYYFTCLEDAIIATETSQRSVRKHEALNFLQAHNVKIERAHQDNFIPFCEGYKRAVTANLLIATLF